MCTPNLPIGTGYPHLMPWTSIGTAVAQHMLLVPNQCSALQTYPAILRPSATMPLLSIPSDIFNQAGSDTKSILGIDYIIRAMCTPNLLIGTRYPHLMPWTSIGTTVAQHMLLVPNQHSALRTYPAILGPSATMPLLSIPSHILKGPVPLPIYFFVLGLGSSEHDELQDSQYKVEYWNQHHGIHFRMVSGADLDVFPPVSQIHESRILEDPGMFSFRTAMLAFTLFFERSWNVPNVHSSAPSRTIASRARLYTLE